MCTVTTVVSTDILVVGGGIAGLMAAIAAADAGAPSVTVLEKAHPRRSGSAGTGNDHFRCYIPEKHNHDYRAVFQELLDGQVGDGHDTVLTKRFVDRSFEMVCKWEKWGIDMRPHGDWEFNGHAFPGRPRVFLKYDGSNQKSVLYRQAKKRGVRFLNNCTCLELLVQEGAAAGVLALDSSDDEPRFVVVNAAKVIFTPGSTTRLYKPTASPGQLFNQAYCPACAGGVGLAWRAGARLVNIDLPHMHVGPRYLARCGKSTWIGVYRYPDGTPLGPFVTTPTKELGDITGDVWKSAFGELMRNGRGPAYIDCSQLSPEDAAYMRWGMKVEGLTGMLDYMDAKGLDPARHAFEFMQYEPMLFCRGLEIDENGQSTLSGLYAAGDVVGNFRAGIAGAAVYGWICGESAAHSLPADGVRPDMAAHPAVAEKLTLCREMLARRDSAHWTEANMALNQIMSDYAPAPGVRSGSLFRAGMKYLDDIRRATLAEMGASCSHSLMRAHEVLDLMDTGAALLFAADQRKETRGPHVRSDYTFTNPLLNNHFLTVWLEEGTPKAEWRERRLAEGLPAGRVI